MCRHAESAPAHWLPAFHPGIHVHVFLKEQSLDIIICAHRPSGSSSSLAPNCVLLECHTHFLSVSSPHSKSLHLTVLPDAADVVHLLKDSLSSAKHTHRATQNMTNWKHLYRNMSNFLVWETFYLSSVIWGCSCPYFVNRSSRFATSLLHYLTVK